MISLSLGMDLVAISNIHGVLSMEIRITVGFTYGDRDGDGDGDGALTHCHPEVKLIIPFVHFFTHNLDPF